MRKRKNVEAKKISLPRELIASVDRVYGSDYGTWAALVSKLLIRDLLEKSDA